MRKAKASSRLFICLFIIYALNTFTKIAFSAVTAALIDEAVLTKTQAGTISGVFWFLYALGQFAGGALANRHSSLLIKISLIGGMATNILMAFSKGYVPMLTVWSINGILQCGLWPSVLSLLVNRIIPEQKGKVFVYIAYCYGIGSIMSYLCTSAVLSVLSWQYLFVFCGIISALGMIPLLYIEKKLLPVLDVQSGDKNSSMEVKKLPKGFVFKSGLIFFCIIFFIKSMCETGIKNWMPTMLLEIHGASPSFTSLLSVALLILNLFGVSLCQNIYKKEKEDEAKSIFVIYFMILPLMLLLLNFRNMNMYVLTVVFSLITVLLYGSGQILSTYFPRNLHVFGKTAFIGGVMNCFAAMGNVAAAYVSGLVADLFGWDAIVYMWIAVISVSIISALILIPLWNRFLRKNNL